MTIYDPLPRGMKSAYFTWNPVPYYYIISREWIWIFFRSKKTGNFQARLQGETWL